LGPSAHDFVHIAKRGRGVVEGLERERAAKRPFTPIPLNTTTRKEGGEKVGAEGRVGLNAPRGAPICSRGTKSTTGEQSRRRTRGKTTRVNGKGGKKEEGLA